MLLDQQALDKYRLVMPRAMKGYAQGLGWKPVAGMNGSIAVYHDPNSQLKQLIVPLDETFDDYAESVVRVVNRLAEFEKREPIEILNHLLLPPSDILSFRELSSETETGDISVDHGCKVIEGVRKALLAMAHSVEVPKPYHPRMSREEAKQFLSRCRMTTDRGSFVLNVACVLDQNVSIPGMESQPYTRRVTTLFMETLQAFNRASNINETSQLVDLEANQGISANLCEAMLMLRPPGDRSSTEVKATWSRAMLPAERSYSTFVQLRQDFFELAEALAPKLRSLPEPKPDQFFGFVEELRGSPSGSESRPSGEVRLTLFDQDEELHAKVEFDADDYAIAGNAHLNRKLIFITGILHRLPRLNRIDEVTGFDYVPVNAPAKSFPT